MKPSFAATLVICGTILLLLPFAYHLHYYNVQSQVFAHRVDTTPKESWHAYGPEFNFKNGRGLVQGLVGAGGLAMILTGILGGFGFFDRKSKDEQDTRVPLDIILRAHQNASGAGPANSGPNHRSSAANSGKIGVRRVTPQAPTPSDVET